MNGKYPICTISTEKGCVCTEIIIFATEIRKPWPYDPNGSPNKRGRSLNNYYEFSMAAPVFLLLYGQCVRMGTVAENGNGCGNGCKKTS